jgi:hypothetical protein
MKATSSGVSANTCSDTSECGVAVPVSTGPTSRGLKSLSKVHRAQRGFAQLLEVVPMRRAAEQPLLGRERPRNLLVGR